MEMRTTQKAFKEIEAELKMGRKNKNIKTHSIVKERAERKKINEMKSGTY